ncbi:MAG TPA: DUF1508 domain-containing protein [Candidatus Limnocylindria bacterium]|nr:DUF1508 domain-containing protein [Candidatus Limnocylindria bacterium]
MDDAHYEAEVYEDLNCGFRWRLVATNGRIVATSGEGYVKRSHAEEMVDAIFTGAGRVLITRTVRSS